MERPTTRAGVPAPSRPEGSRTGPGTLNRDNFAARAARWSAGHWKTAVAGWIALVAIAIGLGTTVGTHMLSSSEQATARPRGRSRFSRARASRRRHRRACSSAPQREPSLTQRSARPCKACSRSCGPCRR